MTGFRQTLRNSALCLVIALSAGVQAQNVDELPDLMRRQPIVLLGEVHDSAAGHRLREQALAEALRRGWRPAIAMEQFDRERQADLDQARGRCGQDADCVIAAATPAKSSWQWAYYRPVVELALRYDLPLLAANLSRQDAGRIVREGYRPVLDEATMRETGLDRPLPDDLLQKQQAAVQAGHCNQLPERVLPGMAQAQAARDAVMAQTLLPYRQRGVVLLAGNGHTRRDIGVARWLDDSGVLSVGFVEQAPATGEFDRFYLIPATKRGDPCAKL